LGTLVQDWLTGDDDGTDRHAVILSEALSGERAGHLLLRSSGEPVDRHRRPRTRRRAGGDVRQQVAAARRGRRRRVRPLAHGRPDRPPSRDRPLVALPRGLLGPAAGARAGKYDASLLMPRGVRDEEFHTAVCELLSDWGSTVATPEVETDATSRSTGGPTASTLWASRRRCPGCGRLRGALGARMARP